MTSNPMTSNPLTKQSEVERAMDVLELSIADLSSKIKILSERIVTIMRVKEEIRVDSEVKREIYNVPLAKRLGENSVACMYLTEDLGDIIGRCEL